MVVICCVPDCPNRCKSVSEQNSPSFFRLPGASSDRVGINAMREIRLHKWLQAIQRSQELRGKSLKHYRVCSRHFHSGKPAGPNDISNLDWVPCLNLGQQKSSQEETITVKAHKSHTRGKTVMKARKVVEDDVKHSQEPNTRKRKMPNNKGTENQTNARITATPEEKNAIVLSQTPHTRSVRIQARPYNSKNTKLWIPPALTEEESTKVPTSVPSSFHTFVIQVGVDNCRLRGTQATGPQKVDKRKRPLEMPAINETTPVKTKVARKLEQQIDDLIRQNELRLRQSSLDTSKEYLASFLAQPILD